MYELKEEYDKIRKQMDELYNEQIVLYKAMIADDGLVEQRKNITYLKKQMDELYNKQIALYKAMFEKEDISCKHL